MAVHLPALARDLRSETAELARVVRAAGERSLELATPAQGWTVRDQLTHVALYDHVAVIALTDPDSFAAIRAEAMPDLQAYVDGALSAGHGRDLDDMLGWLVSEREALALALEGIDETRRVRVPWFGPDMTPASKGTARLMETWAHGQDVADAIGVQRAPTGRLRHVAHIGVRSLANSFRTRDLDVPTADVRVELCTPDGALWAWGDPAAEDRVTGPALDFCLVTTQRRHLDDTALVVDGAVARQWMAIAQAYAGPPGPGRARVATP
jgi:uncharacterized protein (TIGR03084 family)